MSRLLAFIVVIITMLTFAAIASAKSQTQQLLLRQHRQTHNLHHYRSVLRFFHNHPRQAHTKVGRRETYKARVWVKVIIRELAETRTALRPKPVLGHLAGWICIHNQEGAWNASTGNGYYGGLQMSYGWAGRVTNAALLSPAQQIAAAEAEAAEHHWNYGWMHGQWPNTFPPCAGHF